MDAQHVQIMLQISVPSFQRIRLNKPSLSFSGYLKARSQNETVSSTIEAAEAMHMKAGAPLLEYICKVLSRRGTHGEDAYQTSGDIRVLVREGIFFKRDSSSTRLRCCCKYGHRRRRQIVKYL